MPRAISSFSCKDCSFRSRSAEIISVCDLSGEKDISVHGLLIGVLY